MNEVKRDNLGQILDTDDEYLEVGAKGAMDEILFAYRGIEHSKRVQDALAKVDGDEPSNLARYYQGQEEKLTNEVGPRENAATKYYHNNEAAYQQLAIDEDAERSAAATRMGHAYPPLKFERSPEAQNGLVGRDQAGEFDPPEVSQE